MGVRPVEEVEEVGLCDVKRNLRGLTMGIPDTTIGEAPYHLQRHIVGVPEIISHLLHKVAKVIVCYHEHNRPRP